MGQCMKIVIAITLLISCENELLADIGNFDIYQINWQDRVYYLTLESTGTLKDNDLCYYDFQGEYQMEVTDHIDQYLRHSPEVFLHAKMEGIHIDSLSNSSGEPFRFESPIFLFEGRVQVSSDSLFGKYELTGAQNGNTYGIISSTSITAADSVWINRSSMRCIATMDDGFCGYGFFSATIEPDSEQAVILQSELQALMPNEGDRDVERAERRAEEFSNKIEALVEEQIVMIGSCSC